MKILLAGLIAGLLLSLSLSAQASDSLDVFGSEDGPASLSC